jgi:hypothetical protein
LAGLLFVSQSMLDAWAGQGRIDFVGSVMTLLGGDGKGRSYALDPAVRFLRVVGADADPNALLHKVKSATQLRELGAEHLDSSVILGDLAYEVDPGFLAEAAALQAAAAAPTLSAPAPAPVPAREPSAAPNVLSTAPAAPASARSFGSQPLPEELEVKRKEAEALARFLLENLS